MRIKFDSDNRCVIIDRKEFYTLYSIPDYLSIDIDSKTWINTYPIDYNPETPEEVKQILESRLHKDKRIRLFFGDIQTGKDWEEEFDTMGYIGKSTGWKPILILVNNKRSTGGGGILTHCIVKITENGRVLYQNKNYHQSKHEIQPSDLSEYAEMVLFDGDIQARFVKPGQGKRYVDFIEGKRNNK